MSEVRDVGVGRIETVDAQAILDRLAGSDLIARGSVVVISLEAIRQRTGDRWPRRRDDVREYVSRKLDEHLSFHDMRQPISETDFLVAMTSEDGLAAQAVCLKVLEEVLVFFLGAADPADIRIRAVTGVSDSEIACADVDVAHLAAIRERPVLSDRATRPDAGQRTPISFIAASGQQIRVDFTLEHVVSARHRVMAALRVEPTVSLVNGGVIPTSRFSQLSDDDIAQIDRAMFEFGAAYIPKDARSQTPLILPLSFRTLGCRKGRAGLISAVGQMGEHVKQGLLLEIMDIDRGTPTGRLLEIVGLASPLCRGILARVQPARDALEPVRGARLNGLTLDVRAYGLDDRQLGALVRMIGEQMHGHSPARILQGLSDGRQLEAARAAGFTHAGFTAVALPLAA
jgi:hypothetical protein